MTSRQAAALIRKIIRNVREDFLVKAIAALIFLAAAVLWSSVPVCAEEIPANIYSEADARQMITGLEKNISLMKSSGLDIAMLEAMLEEMKMMSDAKDYNGVSQLYLESQVMVSDANYAHSMIQDTRIMLDLAAELGLNVTDAQLSYQMADSYLKAGNYETAIDYISRSYTSLSEILHPYLSQAITSLNATISSCAQHSLECSSAKEFLAGLQKYHSENDVGKLSYHLKEAQQIDSSIALMISLDDNARKLQEQGFGTSKVDDIIIEMQRLLAEKQYGQIYSLHDSTLPIFETILELNNSISSTHDLLIQKQDTQTYMQSWQYLNLSIAEFNNENYEKSKSHLDKSLALLTEAESRSVLSSVFAQASAGRGIYTFIKENLFVVILVVVAILMMSAALWFFIVLKRLEHTAKYLENEQATITEVLKRLQYDYYKHKSVDKQTYDAQYDALQDRLGSIKKDLPIVKEDIVRRRAVIERATRFKDKLYFKNRSKTDEHK